MDDTLAEGRVSRAFLELTEKTAVSNVSKRTDTHPLGNRWPPPCEALYSDRLRKTEGFKWTEARELESQEVETNSQKADWLQSHELTERKMGKLVS